MGRNLDSADRPLPAIRAIPLPILRTFLTSAPRNCSSAPRPDVAPARSAVSASHSDASKDSTVRSPTRSASAARRASASWATDSSHCDTSAPAAPTTPTVSCDHPVTASACRAAASCVSASRLDPNSSSSSSASSAWIASCSSWDSVTAPAASPNGLTRCSAKGCVDSPSVAAVPPTSKDWKGEVLAGVSRCATSTAGWSRTGSDVLTLMVPSLGRSTGRAEDPAPGAVADPCPPPFVGRCGGVSATFRRREREIAQRRSWGDAETLLEQVAAAKNAVSASPTLPSARWAVIRARWYSPVGARSPRPPSPRRWPARAGAGG